MEELKDIFKHTCLGFDPSVKPCEKFIQGGFCNLPNQFRCTEWLKVHEPILSYSSIKTFSHCKRKFWYDQIVGLETITPLLPLLQGQIASKIMAHLHNYSLTIPEHRTIIKEMASPYIGENEDKITLWPYQMAGFFDGYVELEYHTMKCTSEYKFLWQEPEYPKLTGYIDRVPYIEHGGDGIVPSIGYEDKYSKNPDWYEMFTMKDQLTTYFLGVPTMERITTRILVHPELRLAKNETVKDFVRRVSNDVVKRPKHYIRDTNYFRTEFSDEFGPYKWKMRMIVREIVDLIKYGIDGFYQDTDACFTPPCQFKPICSSNDTISDTLFRKKEWKGHAQPLYTGKSIKKDEPKEKEEDNPWQ